jgi:hypothetical protein
VGKPVVKIVGKETFGRCRKWENRETIGDCKQPIALVGVHFTNQPKRLATKMIGGRGKVHKAIREALEKDAELKARYEAILADVKDPNKS